MKPHVRLAVLVTAVTLGACGGSHRYPGPGTPAPRAWVDTLPIAEPSELPAPGAGERLEELLVETPEHGLSITRLVSGIPPALNVDAFDRTPASTWWEPRITGGHLGVAEIAAGPPLAGPDTADALTVVAGKVDGVTPGFTVEDAQGVTFLLKFDPPGMSGLGSGADVVSSRIFWAAGYHVPKDVVIYIDPAELVLADDAEVETADGDRPMTQDDVEDALARTDRRSDGRIRALASRFLDGTPKGPFRFEGRRDDDPNDYYPHEDRRELRGMWALAAWINHVDLRVQNTLDMYVEPGGYLRHHVIDFATTLGSGAIRYLNPREGREYAFDAGATTGRLLTLGLYRKGWEGLEGAPLHPALGWLRSDDFDPGAWKPFIAFEAYRRLTDRDAYWGAKLVAAFEEEELRAIIAEAHYPDEAADLLLDVLLTRRTRGLLHWFGRVSPVEEAQVVGSGSTPTVEFRDLGLEESLWTSEETTYVWRWGDASGTSSATDGARQRLTLEPGPEELRLLERSTPEQPVTVELEVRRGERATRPAHLRLHHDGVRIRVSGLIH